MFKKNLLMLFFLNSAFRGSNLLNNVEFRLVPIVAVGNDCHGDTRQLLQPAKHAAILTVGVVAGHPLEDLVHEDDGHRELHDGHPLVDAEGSDVEDNVEEVNVEDHEVEGEGQGHGHQQPDVALQNN